MGSVVWTMARGDQGCIEGGDETYVESIPVWSGEAYVPLVSQRRPRSRYSRARASRSSRMLRRVQVGGEGAPAPGQPQPFFVKGYAPRMLPISVYDSSEELLLAYIIIFDVQRPVVGSDCAQRGGAGGRVYRSSIQMRLTYRVVCPWLHTGPSESSSSHDSGRGRVIVAL
jgi:hypothetical protein